MTFISRLRFTVTALALLILAGCSSKDPMDYLPESPAYIAFSAEQARSSDGGKRLLKAAEQLHPEAAQLFQSKLKRIYIAAEPGEMGRARGQRGEQAGSGVALGESGFSKFAEDQFRQNGATEQKMAGRKVLTSGTMSISAVGDNGLLVFSRQQDLEKMIRTADKKSPSARQSATFQTAESLLASHSFAAVADWSQILSLIGPGIEQVAIINPKGVEALKQVRSVSLALSWNEQPLLEAILHLPNAEGRDDLAGLVNMGIGTATKVKPKNFDTAMLSMLNDLKAETSSDGVAIKLAVPKEMADKWLTAMEEHAKNK